MATSCIRELQVDRRTDNSCQALQMIKYYKGQHIIHITDPVLEQYHKAKTRARNPIDPTCLRWKPPVFTRSQLAFGF